MALPALPGHGLPSGPRISANALRTASGTRARRLQRSAATLLEKHRRAVNMTPTNFWGYSSVGRASRSQRFLAILRPVPTVMDTAKQRWTLKESALSPMLTVVWIFLDTSGLKFQRQGGKTGGPPSYRLGRGRRRDNPARYFGFTCAITR
jgi:hypothetical protein